MGRHGNARSLGGLDARGRPGILLATFLLAGLIPAGTGADPAQWHEQGQAALARARDLPRSSRARNVILFVGDGMGVSTVTAARILAGQLRGEPGEENLLAFERLPYLALSKTYNTDQQVSDSAGTMTAMVTGVKTRAGVLSVDESVQRADWAGARGHELPTLIERAEQRGLATGIVTTTTVTHATPAAGYAHSADRNWEDDSSLPQEAREADYPDIARQLIEFPHGDGLELVLGGGRKRFLPAATAAGESAPSDPLASMLAPQRGDQGGKRLDGRDLTAEWAARDGAIYVATREQWDDIDWSSGPRVLGLFAWSHLDFAAHRARMPDAPPPLEELTAKAIARLSQNDAGFVLVVEAGRIDHGHHASSAYLALHDTIELSRAVQAALDAVDLDETLIVVTADHDHTLAMAGYAKRGNPILGLSRSPHPEHGEILATDGLGKPYTTLGYLNGPGWIGPSKGQPQGAKRYPHYTRKWEAEAGPRPVLSDEQVQSPDYLQESAIPMMSETHTGHDVPIYAAGPGAHLFHGVHEQSYIYHVAVEALGWNRRSGWLDWLIGDD